MAGLRLARTFDIVFTQVDYGLRAHVTGINGTLETTLAYWRCIAEKVCRTRPPGVLVVDDMDGEPPQLLAFVLSMKGEGMEDVHIAYVERRCGGMRHQLPPAGRCNTSAGNRAMISSMNPSSISGE